MHRDKWYVINPRRRNRAALLVTRYEWLARLATYFVRHADYGKPGTFHKSYR